jgi:hypothetical protein
MARSNVALDVRHLGAGDLGQRLQRLRDREAAEADALVGVEVRDVGDQAANAAGATDRLGDRHVADLHGTVLLEQLGRPRAPSIDLLSEFVL